MTDDVGCWLMIICIGEFLGAWGSNEREKGNLHHVEAVDGDGGGGSDGASVIGTVGIDVDDDDDDTAAAVLELSSTRC